jgi:heme exporter protein CcmD
MKTFFHFLTMGGYAHYVWPAYGITFMILTFQYWQSKRTAKKIKNAIRERLQ